MFRQKIMHLLRDVMLYSIYVKRCIYITCQYCTLSMSVYRFGSFYRYRCYVTFTPNYLGYSFPNLIFIEKLFVHI